MLGAMLNGQEDVNELADLAEGRLRKKLAQLKLALEGHVTEHHRYLLGRLLSHVGYLERQSKQFSERIRRRLDELLAVADQERLDRIVGVNRTTIENVIAEIGVDMGVFPDEHHMASWCGVCPGNEESGGKRLRSRTRRGNRWLRRALVQVAWAASHTKNSYLAAQFRRLAARRGQKRALVAVGHSILVIIYHVLGRKVEYQDLGAAYFDRLEPERMKRYLVKRLQTLGYDVTLMPKEPSVAV
jgi:transposase